MVNRADRRPVLAAAVSVPGAPGARLDKLPWASSWGSFLNAVRDKDDGYGARRTIRKIMDSRPQPRNALGERVPAEGGYLVPERLRQQVLAYMTGAIVRPRATIVPMDSERVPLPSLENPSQASSAQALGGLTFSLIQEGAAWTGTTPNFGRVVLEAWKVGGYLQNVPNELISDSPAFGDFLARIIALGYTWWEDDYALYSGNGVGEPQALVNAPGGYALSRNTSSKVLHADIVGMLKALHPASKATATWLLSESAFDYLLELYELASTGAAADISPPQTLVYDMEFGTWRLLGLPAIVNDHQPAVGTTGDVMLCDLGLMLIGERSEMTVEVSPESGGFISDSSNIRIKARTDMRYWPQSTYTTTTGQSVAPLVVLH